VKNKGTEKVTPLSKMTMPDHDILKSFVFQIKSY